MIKSAAWVDFDGLVDSPNSSYVMKLNRRPFQLINWCGLFVCHHSVKFCILFVIIVPILFTSTFLFFFFLELNFYLIIQPKIKGKGGAIVVSHLEKHGKLNEKKYLAPEN